MRYLKCTTNYMLTYRRFNDLAITDYSDFDFVGCLDDHKLTSRYIFIMIGGVVSRKSVKQSLIITSV